MEAAGLTLLTRFSLVCVALLCAVPFLQSYHRFPLTSFYSEWLAFALGIGTMTILLQRRAWEPAEVPWVALLPFALAVLLIVHGALGWSPYFGQALTGALYLLWAGSLIVASRALVRACGAHTVFAVFAAGLAAGALLSALAGIVQYFNLTTPFNAFIVRPPSAAIFGNLGQTNHFAAYTMLGLLSLVYLHSRDRIALAVAVICALPMLFVLGLSGSRSVWLYLIAAGVLAAWLSFASPRTGVGRRLIVACGALLIINLAMQLLVGAGWFSPADREAVTAVGRWFSGAASISDRYSLWHAAWTMALNNPLFGVGWGAFSWRYFEYATGAGAAGGYTLYHNAHNLPLHLLAETGVIGVALVAVPLLIWLRQTARNVYDVHHWWLFAVLAVLGLHSLLEFPLWYAYFLGLAAVLLGAAPARVFVTEHARIGRMLTLAVVLGGAFNLATLGLDYRDFDRVLQPDSASQGGDDFADTMRRLHRNPVLTPYIEVAIALPLTVEAENLEQRLLFTGQVMSFAPLPTLLYRQVLQLALAGRLEESQELLVRSKRAYPVPPPEFASDLARLSAAHPERFRPLLESRVHRPLGRQ